MTFLLLSHPGALQPLKHLLLLIYRHKKLDLLRPHKIHLKFVALAVHHSQTPSLHQFPRNLFPVKTQLRLHGPKNGLQ